MGIYKFGVTPSSVKAEANHKGQTMDTLTVKQLRDSLAQLGPAYDDKPIHVWLPGSRIALGSLIPGRPEGVLIEGNVVPGSALDHVVEESTRTLADRDALENIATTLRAQLLPDALCKEKGGLTAASRTRCMALVTRLQAALRGDH